MMLATGVAAAADLAVCPLPVYLISQEHLEVKLLNKLPCGLMGFERPSHKKKKARTPRNPPILQKDTSLNSNSTGAWKHNRSETVRLLFHPALVQFLYHRAISCVEKEA